jgi:hypothetical protein
MDRKTRRDVVATLIKAGRRDLARIVVGDSIDKAFGRHPKGQKARKLIEQLGGTVDDHFTTFGEDQVYVGIAKFNSEQQATQFQAAVRKLGFDTVRQRGRVIRIAFGPPEETQQLGKHW